MTEKLNDVLTGEGTNLAYISGMLDGRQIDCEGPIELPYKINKPTWPFIPAIPEYDPSAFKNPVFDYAIGNFVEKDVDAQAEQIAKLKQENEELKQENVTLKSEIQDIQQGQINTTTVLGQLLPAVQQLAAFASNAQKATETDTSKQEETDASKQIETDISNKEGAK